VKFELVMVHWY